MNGYDVPVSYGQPDNWWLRSPWTDYDRGSCIIKPIGVIDDGSGGVTYSYGQAAYWWLRSPVTDDTFHSWLIIPDGDVVSYGRNVYSMRVMCTQMATSTTSTMCITIPTENILKYYIVIYFEVIHQADLDFSVKLITGGFALRSPMTLSTRG